MSQLISYEDAIEAAYDIFLEMAPDNLEQPDLLLFATQFDERGAAEVVEIADDWVERIGAEVDHLICAEIHIGLVDQTNDILTDTFARLLISRDPAQKFCHIVWKRLSN
jgi:uncharacterized protein YciU (UPF0263 family)